MLTSQSLLAYNSFGFAVQAKHYTEIHTEAQVKQALREAAGRPVLVLGGGSNILFTHDPETVVFHNRILGKEVIDQTREEVILRIGGGEHWHKFVRWCLSKNWGGLENLSLIPGTVGASPIQNIGAYGVELKDVFHGLEAIDLQTGEEVFFEPEACAFGYRDSIFKTALKGKLLISQVYFRLSRKNHRIQAEYGAIRDTLTEWNIDEPTIQDISRAVVAIRQSKLPDPEVLGNAGSFFKNPEVDQAHFELLLEQFPNLIYYPLPNQQYKIPAGWLIDQCGWKGKRLGPVGCYEKQALVLVNYGGATGAQVLELADQIMSSVVKKFGIQLEPEVNIV